jgi:prepilin-type N-terminal cleavage/methylation domain-containing protein/prepilin-type processing-associated H-X9-DG protein
MTHTNMGMMFYKTKADFAFGPSTRLTRACARRRGLTLIELLVVVAIIALLVSILAPALTSARSRMKSLKCASNLRTVGFEFQLFADGLTPEGQGDSAVLGPERFYINDFQDYLYGIDEFWDAPNATAATLAPDESTVMCPAGKAQLVKRAGYPCSSAALQPEENVSLAVNMRLYRAAASFRGRPVLAPAAATSVSSRILQNPYVPLMLEVDGPAAVAARHEPFYIAPPLDDGDRGPYSSGRYWAPSTRHAGDMNVVFVGGHVLSSQHPQRETWDWSYQPEVSR